MKITKRQLRHLINEELTAPAENDYVLTILSALERDDLKTAAKIIVDNTDGIDLGAVIEDMRFEWPEFADIVKRKPKIFRQLEKVAYDESHRRNVEAIRNSKYSKELRVLSQVFTTTVAPDSVKYIVYQPIVRSGNVVSISLQDTQHALGHMQTSISDYDAKQARSSLARVLAALENLGASLQKRKPKRKFVHSVYD